jgi:glycosyltransferase involved in cell wall biosynthesis
VEGSVEHRPLILLDVTRPAGRLLEGRLATGVDRVDLAYIEHFRRRARALVRYGARWLELEAQDSQRVFDALLSDDSRSAGVLRWRVARAYALRWKRAGSAVLINAGHGGLDDPSYAVQVRRRGLRAVFFLHDLIPITHAEYARPGEADRHRQRLQTMREAGAGLVVNSAATRGELQDYADRKGWALPPCVVAPLAPARLPPPSADRPLAEPYFVVLGTIEPRKNHLLLLHLWREFAAQREAFRLVVIGQRGWECEQVVDLLERCAPLRGFVREEAGCSDARLATWLHHARALLFPSFAEGYGLPLVEALANGVPAIASELPAFREIAGAIPEYLDPLDGAAWRRTIRQYADPAHAARGAQLGRLQGFAPPTWRAHFEQVEELLARVGA